MDGVKKLGSGIYERRNMGAGVFFFLQINHGYAQGGHCCDGHTGERLQFVLFTERSTSISPVDELGIRRVGRVLPLPALKKPRCATGQTRRHGFK